MVTDEDLIHEMFCDQDDCDGRCVLREWCNNTVESRWPDMRADHAVHITETLVSMILENAEAWLARLESRGFISEDRRSLVPDSERGGER